MASYRKSGSLWVVSLITLFIVLGGKASAQSPNTFFLMPINCSELLPDNTPFVGYMEAVARGMAGTDKNTATRIFRVLAIQKRLEESGDWSPQENPVGILLRKTICYYRQQKKPTHRITFDDRDFISFFKASLLDLEKKVKEAVFTAEFEKEQKKVYEARIRGNRGIIQKIKRTAQKQAASDYRKITKNAKKKARNQ